MAFPTAIRPYLLPLAATTPSPFDPELRGRPVDGKDEGKDDGKDGNGKDTGGDGPGAVPEVRVDLENLDVRAVPLPVPAGRLHGLQAAKDALLWLEQPLAGELGDARGPGQDSPRAGLRRYDLRTRSDGTLVGELDDALVTGDGTHVLVRDGSAVRLLPADRELKDPDDDARIDVDLGRLRVALDPVATWQQMFEENGRLMRDHFWIEDFAGVDWEEALSRYRPLIERLGSRDDLSEVLWEVLGELGSSHAYESPPERPVDRTRGLGHLGADLAPDADGTWRVVHVVPGEPSAPAARSPLQAPGVVVRPGDAVVAVDGRPVDPVTGPGPLLVGAGAVPVELTVERPDGDPGGSEGASGTSGTGERLRFAVRPLPDERPLRYHAWVAGRRRAVHELSDGRVGYLHIPDMMATGWAELHRDLHLEVLREALVVDVRHNGGGHLSELVLERLARTLRGWATVRHGVPEQYPSHAPRGPLVAVADQWAGSDGDIVTAGFKALGLGPVVGKRTWGGVIGIDGRYSLVDGTSVTQPRYAFWFTGYGWDIENHGVDPDVEVDIAPQDWAAGRDTQLETAVRIALEALGTHTPFTPPDPATRPDRAAPTLPPRPGASTAPGPGAPAQPGPGTDGPPQPMVD
jgi:tricorn protease